MQPPIPNNTIRFINPSLQIRVMCFKIFGLMRVHQWYKNLLVFLPILFGQRLFDFYALELTIIGFLALCFVSSSNYILNDFIDLKRDMHSPIRKKKYLARGDISKTFAALLAIVLFIAGVYLAVNISAYFFYFVAALFILNQFYSLLFKQEVFVDVIVISINFVIRAVSGAYIIVTAVKEPYIWVSPWLIVGVFFLALFLAVGKRYAEISVLKQKALKFRPVLKFYSHKLIEALMIVSTSVLLVSYALYSFLGSNKSLIFTLPFAIYAIFRYFYLVYDGSSIPLAPNRFYEDKRLVISIILWLIVVIIALYW